ncbi:MAG: glycosyltransferase family 2 protein [Crenarchaeota archaeon]|nr:glycosyltransferase family 2 protein [Thermoproteota archaeon]
MAAEVSVIIPSKGCRYLIYILRALRGQTRKPSEIILVLKGCNTSVVEKLCESYALPCMILEQKVESFTNALNMGKREAGKDILIFTDDDAIPPSKWVEYYVKLHELHRNIAGISSRDVYFDVIGGKTSPTPDNMLHVRAYRWLVRPWLEPPLPQLKKYRFGVYISKNFDVKHGPFIPNKTCYSLPFRGVNMSFKSQLVYDVWFPEHPRLKKSPGNEQYFGLQIVLKGFDTIYVPSNPVYHITRTESLSRTSKKREVRTEFDVMKSLYASLLSKNLKTRLR